MTIRNMDDETADVQFKCRYPTTLDVSSGPFNVDHDIIDEIGDEVGNVTHGGNIEAVGSLNDGFELTLLDADGVTDRVQYGQMIQVQTEWKLKTLVDVRFNYKACKVNKVYIRSVAGE